jgi:iron(III) transport system permease protein
MVHAPGLAHRRFFRVARTFATYDTGDWVRFGVQVGTIAIVAVLVLLPIAMLLYGSFRTAAPGAEGSFTLENYRLLLSSRYLDAFLNTVKVSVASTVLCVVFGTLLAFLVFRTNMPYRNLMAVLLTSSFYFPSFVSAQAWVLLLAPRSGMINNLIQDYVPGFPIIPIYSLAGIIWVVTLAYIPYVFLFLSAPFRSIDPSLEEASLTSGAGIVRTLRRVTLPLVSYALVAGGLITFILSAGLFGAPSILGTPVRIFLIPTQIFSLLNFYPANYPAAAALGGLLLVVTIVAILLQRAALRGQYTTITGKGYRPRQIDLGRYRWPAFGLCMLYFLLAVALPVAALAYSSVTPFYTGRLKFESFSLANYQQVLFSLPTTSRALINSFILSAGGATIAMVLAGLVSYLVIKGKVVGRQSLDVLSMMPLAFPGIVIAVGLLWAYIRTPIYGTVLILIVSYVTHYLPHGVRTVSSNLVQLDDSLEESARTSGASWLRSLRTIVLPLMRGAFMSGWLLLFVAFFRELSSAILLYTPGNEVVSIVIWDLYQNGNFGLMAALAMITLVLIYVVFAIAQIFGSAATNVEE